MDRRIVSFLLVAVTLSGCASNDPAETNPCTEDPSLAECSEGTDGTGQEGNSTTDPSNSGTGNETNQTSQNTAPLGALAFPAGTATAGAPATFTITVSDADGDELYWSFDADGDGAMDLDGNQSSDAIFTFDAEGTYTATLNVTDGTAYNVTSVEVIVDAEVQTNDPNAPEDRGWYIYHPLTDLCEVKSYTDVGGLGLVYNSPLSGGDWYVVESNQKAGLQIENNHPLAPAGTIPFVGGFAMDIDDCKGGDQVAV